MSRRLPFVVTVAAGAALALGCSNVPFPVGNPPPACPDSGDTACDTGITPDAEETEAEEPSEE